MFGDIPGHDDLPPTFHQLLIAIDRAMAEGDGDRALALIERYVTQGDLYGLLPSDEAVTLYQRLLMTAVTENRAPLWRGFCRLGVVLARLPDALYDLCLMLARIEDHEPFRILCAVLREGAGDALDVALLAACNAGRDDLVQHLGTAGANLDLIAELTPETNQPPTLHMILDRARRDVQLGRPLLARLRIERYLAERHAQAIRDGLIERESGAWLRGVRLAIRVQALEILAADSQRGPRHSCFRRLLTLMFTVRERHHVRLASLLCIVIEGFILTGSPHLDWERLVNSGDIGLISTLHERLRFLPRGATVLDLCLITTVRNRNHVMLRRLIIHCQGHVVVMGNSGPTLRMVHAFDCFGLMRLCWSCANRNGLMIIVACSLMFDSGGRGSCDHLMQVAVRNGQWHDIAMLMMLGLAPAAILMEDNPDPGPLPDPDAMRWLLSRIRNLLLRIWRLPPVVRLRVHEDLFRPAFLPERLVAFLVRIGEALGNTAILEEIAVLRGALLGSINDLPDDWRHEPDAPPEIILTEEMVRDLPVLCDILAPHGLAKLMAWITLYLLDDPRVISRAEIMEMVRMLYGLGLSDDEDSQISDDSGDDGEGDGNGLPPDAMRQLLQRFWRLL